MNTSKQLTKNECYRQMLMIVNVMKYFNPAMTKSQIYYWQIFLMNPNWPKKYSTAM
jgi:hypothetical protein